MLIASSGSQQNPKEWNYISIFAVNSQGHLDAEEMQKNGKKSCSSLKPFNKHRWIPSDP